MLTFQMTVVIAGIIGMVAALVANKMRPGMVLFSVCVVFLCAKIITPEELLEGFSNEGMVTVALLFLVSEGIRQSGALRPLVRLLMPKTKTTVMKAQMRMLPAIATLSTVLNNTPIVVLFAPIVKKWAKSVGMSASKFLIPVSYAAILGGMCTLIGTSTNLVVHGMIIGAGYEGFSMFELAKVGVPVAVAGLIYILCVSQKLLPDRTGNDSSSEQGADEADETACGRRVEAVIGARFPGINMNLKEFDFRRHFGAEVVELKRVGESFRDGELDSLRLTEGDTLVINADDSFMKTWGESSAFLMLTAYEEQEPHSVRRKRWFALALLILMITGATVGTLPAVKEAFPEIRLDMFFFAAVTAVVMAWTKLYPPRKYTKYISWDVLITIACAFGISKAMANSGFSDLVASKIIALCHDSGPHVLLFALYVITNLFTELITNNAAAALTFPLALSLAQELGVDPMPFFVTICIAASASFSTPIGYQTNLIVQGVGNYKFTDFVRIGLPLNVITCAITVFLVPLLWPF